MLRKQRLLGLQTAGHRERQKARQERLGPPNVPPRDFTPLSELHDFSWSRRLWGEAAKFTFGIFCVLIVTFVACGTYFIGWMDGRGGVDVIYLLMATVTTVGWRGARAFARPIPPPILVGAPWRGVWPRATSNAARFSMHRLHVATFLCVLICALLGFLPLLPWGVHVCHMKVGYGDMSPTSRAARIAFFPVILFGLIIIGTRLLSLQGGHLCWMGRLVRIGSRLGSRLVCLFPCIDLVPRLATACRTPSPSLTFIGFGVSFVAAYALSVASEAVDDSRLGGKGDDKDARGKSFSRQPPSKLSSSRLLVAPTADAAPPQAPPPDRASRVRAWLKAWLKAWATPSSWALWGTVTGKYLLLLGKFGLVCLVGCSFMLLSSKEQRRHGDLSVIDGLYFAAVTCAGVGYGDVFPLTVGGKAFYSPVFVAGTIAVGGICGKVRPFGVRGGLP